MRTLTFALSLFWTIIFLINCNQSLAIVNGTRGYGVNGYQGVVLIYPNGGKPVGTEVQVCQGALISRIHVLTVKTCCDELVEFSYSTILIILIRGFPVAGESVILLLSDPRPCLTIKEKFTMWSIFEQRRPHGYTFRILRALCNLVARSNTVLKWPPT